MLVRRARVFFGGFVIPALVLDSGEVVLLGRFHMLLCGEQVMFGRRMFSCHRLFYLLVGRESIPCGFPTMGIRPIPPGGADPTWSNYSWIHIKKVFRFGRACPSP